MDQLLNPMKGASLNLETLLEVTNALNSQRDLESLWRVIADQIAAELECRAGKLKSLVELEQQGDEPAVRPRGDQQAVGAAGVRTREGAGGRPAELIREQPLAHPSRIRPDEDILSVSHAAGT